jgi:phage baseplate assembly protein W
MGSFSFKSSGKTQSQRLADTLSSTTIPIGIKTPLRLGTSEGLLAMNFTLADQLHDNFRNLLQTNFGEHLGIYDFGANLRPLVTEFASQDDFDTQAIDRIKVAVSRWMSFIDLDNFVSTVDRTTNKNTAVINVAITYNIPALNVVGKVLQVTLYVI